MPGTLQEIKDPAMDVADELSLVAYTGVGGGRQQRISLNLGDILRL